VITRNIAGVNKLVFESILYREIENKGLIREEHPDFFLDLNLDQVIKAITEQKKDYHLDSIFYTPLKNIHNVTYRQKVFLDLQNERILQSIRTFSDKMEKMYRYLSGIERLYRYQKERWLMDSAEIYCEAVQTLFHDLTSESPESEAFKELIDYVGKYITSDEFENLRKETSGMRKKLDAVRFTMIIKTGKIVVKEYGGEEDYSAEIKDAFSKFSESGSGMKKVRTPQFPGMNHVEAAILDLVARIYPETFQDLLDYYEKNIDFIDPTIGKFQKEVQFYLTYIDHIAKLKDFGLQFCIPEISEVNRNVSCYDGFDIGLADKLTREGKAVVTNDFFLEGDQRIIVVTGPNHGGKTTFARMFGQTHYLGILGLPVPGTRSSLFLFDNIFTHFERSENLDNNRGKLEDDLVRIKTIMDRSTSRSIIIINEMLSSTTLKDAVTIGKKIVSEILGIGCLCLYVTFLDELASLDGTVSMVSTIVPDNPEERTYKIVKEPADGLAYAMALARKYRVTYDEIIRRISS
jgi:DNA mismatch repair ATPase MutS